MALQYTTSFANWAEPEAKVTLVIIPRLHKEGFFVGVGLTPAQPYSDELFKVFQKVHDENFRRMVYGDFTS